MSWISDANELVPIKLKEFIPLKGLLLFIILIASVFVILFPQRTVIKQLLTVTQAYPMAVAYLHTLLKQEPQNTTFRLALANQEIGLGHWFKAEIQIGILRFQASPKDLILLHQIDWTQFTLDLALTYQAKPHTIKRELYEEKTYKEIQQLAKNNVNTTELTTLAEAALGLNHPPFALSLYKEILSIHPNQSPKKLAHIARVALMAQDYQLSGDLYVKAAHKANLLMMKRTYLYLGLRAYQANSMFANGLKAIEEFPPSMMENKEILLFLTRYALAANRPDIAQKYILIVLKMDGTK